MPEVEKTIVIVWDRVNGTFDVRGNPAQRIVIEDQEGEVIADIWP